MHARVNGNNLPALPVPRGIAQAVVQRTAMWWDAEAPHVDDNARRSFGRATPLERFLVAELGTLNVANARGSTTRNHSAVLQSRVTFAQRWTSTDADRVRVPRTAAAAFERSHRLFYRLHND